jgi:hypothetical protein
VAQALLDRGALARLDAVSTTTRRTADRLSAPVPAHPYQVGDHAAEVFAALGIPADALRPAPPGRRPLLRFCVDWSEQRHHLGGGLGAALLAAFETSGWITRRPADRAVELTEPGSQALADVLDLRPDGYARPRTSRQAGGARRGDQSSAPHVDFARG